MYTSDAYHGFSTTVFSYKPSQAMTAKLKKKELFSYVIYSRQVHCNLHVELGRSEDWTVRSREEHLSFYNPKKVSLNQQLHSGHCEVQTAIGWDSKQLRIPLKVRLIEKKINGD